jgi:uncharacterized membrane protein YagU involved in acid resistance
MQQLNRNTLVREIVTPAWKGAVAGCVATLPMTATMFFLQRRLPPRQRTALPPKKITMGVLRRLGLKQHMSGPEEQRTAWAAHFAYGTGMGAVYAPLARKAPLPSPLKGMMYGLIVWAAGYLGWLPAMDLPGSAPDESMQRNAMMIAAHLVWGGVTGAVQSALRD